jgi:hypothetical protein
MPASKEERAQQALSKLFESLSIKRVVCVDDEYAFSYPAADAIGLIVGLDRARVGAVFQNRDIPFGPDRVLWVPQFEEFWQGLSVPERRQKLSVLQGIVQGDAKTRADLIFANALADLFVSSEFKQFSFSEWKNERDKYLEDAVATRTLFLFDEDLSRDGGGIEAGRELVRQVLASDAKAAMVGLISHNIFPDKEFEISKKFTDPEYGFDPERVIPIAKSSLGSNPLAFARTIKLTVLSPDFFELKKLSLQVMKDAQTKTETELHAINVNTFAHIVFDASNHEGIWEPDTVFRLINLYQRKEARSLAAKNEELRNVAEKIRQVTNIPTSFGKTDRPDAYSGPS